ncbi:multinuclear nonheme iron-dependent oxidase, partial [Pseudomonas aeruginosa]
MQREFVSGAGLGLRRALLEPLGAGDEGRVDFLEVAPENWIGIGGRLGRQFRELTERLPFLCHGLSLNLGGYAPLDMSLLRAIKGFIEQHGIRAYSEHLSACADDGQLYDLMPLPFSDESVRRVAERVRVVQDVLERPLIVENVSAYARLPGELEEVDFVRAVLEEADCQLLLDVNNV